MTITAHFAEKPIWIIPDTLAIWNHVSYQPIVAKELGFRSLLSLHYERKTAGEYGVELCYGMSVRDNYDNPATVLSDAVYYIGDCLSVAPPTLVLCLAGMSRSVCAVAAYLILNQGVTAAEALAHISGCYREQQNSIGPSQGMRTLLKEFEDVYLKR